MGDTLPLSQEGACLGRSVTSWTSVCGLWPACSMARRWPSLCEEFGISRKTGYKIYDRYKDAGLQGLTDRSRRPHRHANQLPMAVEKLIVRLKKEYPHWGAPKLRERLRQRWPEVACPAISTVHAVLDRHGLVTSPAPASPPAADGHAARRSRAPRMRLWCADYKGEFLLANRRYCYPLTITDFASRYLIACEAQSTTQGALRLCGLRARVSGFRAARRDPHRQRRAVRLGARALRAQQTGGLVAAPGHRPRADRAGASRAERATRAPASDAEDRSDASRRRRTSCSSRRASIPSCSASTTSGRIRRSTCRRPPVAVHAVAASLSRPRGARVSGPRLDRGDHHVRPHLLSAAQDQCQPGVCRTEGRRETGRTSTSGSSPSCTTTWAISTMRPADSNRSIIPSARNCYPCLRNNLLPMSPE